METKDLGENIQLDKCQIILTFAHTSKALCQEVNSSKNWTSWLEALDGESRAFYRSIYHGNFYQQAFVAAGQESAFTRLVYHGLSQRSRPVSVLSETIKVDMVEAFVSDKDFVQMSFYFSPVSCISEEKSIDILRLLKSPESLIEVNGKNLLLVDYLKISAHLSADLSNVRSFFLYFNGESSEIDTKERMISHCHKAGNFITSENSYQNNTSQRYYQEQIEENGLDLFESWFALILNDTFVRIGKAKTDPFARWVKDYASVYLYQLALKNYLSQVNSKLASVTGLKRSIRRTKDEFIEFLNDTQFNLISSKFLPNILYSKLNETLGLKEEMVILEKKLERISDHLKEKREEAFNTALIIITMLSVFSVVLDISLWFDRIGFMGEWLWPAGSLLTAGLITVFIIAFFLIRTRR